jgi:hypothetical protein
MSDDQERLDELVDELNSEGDRAGHPSMGLVDDVVATARWQAVVRRALGNLVGLAGSIGEAARIGMGGKPSGGER